MKIEFSGKWARDPITFGVVFDANVNGQSIQCKVTTDALQDINPEHAMDTPENQFSSNQYWFQEIAEEMIKDGKVSNGILVIDGPDVRA